MIISHSSLKLHGCQVSFDYMVFLLKNLRSIRVISGNEITDTLNLTVNVLTFADRFLASCHDNEKTTLLARVLSNLLEGVTE